MGYRLPHQTITKLWQQSPGAIQAVLALGDSHRHPERYEARLQVIKLFAQGWTKRSIRHVVHGSRPTIDRWLHRLAAEHFAGLEDKSRAPKVPARKVWFALMIDVYHLQKRHPDAGEFRLWSL